MLKVKLLPLYVFLISIMVFAACAGTGKFYKMELRAGDIITGTLISNVKIKTSRGAIVDIPANNIEEIEIGRMGGVEVELRDGNEIEGSIMNETLTMKLTATGKEEVIAVSKIKRFERD
jgi:hypothetical protein